MRAEDRGEAGRIDVVRAVPSDCPIDITRSEKVGRCNINVSCGDISLVDTYISHSSGELSG